MPTEAQLLSSFVDEHEPEEDPATDAATDAAERADGKTPEDSTTTELPDGGAIITLNDGRDVRRAEKFYENLAETLPSSWLSDAATKLLDLIDKDKEARKKRDKQYAKAIQEAGVQGVDAAGGAEFEGASRVQVPLLAEVNIDFAARAIKELWPADGPVKDKIVGAVTDKKQAKATRKKEYMNWLLTEKLPGVRYELEQILTQVPMGGVQYSKWRYDRHRRRPWHEIAWVDEILLPWGATSFYTADRKTHVQMINEFEFDQRVRSKMYRDLEDSKIVTVPDQTEAQSATDKVEGREMSAYNEDGLRTVYEVDVQYLVPDKRRKVDEEDRDDKGPAPYLITIDLSTHKILSVYRNWDEFDEDEEPLVHIIEWPFIPWRGAMPIGTPQVLGGIATAATGALRALLDSAHINNFPGGMRLKSGPVGGQSVRIDAGQTTELEGSINQDDIRKTFMPTPVNQTSPVLFELLGFLVDAGKEVVKTTLDEADDNPNVPVGTTMARIEQGMVVFSAIHSRLHNAMGKWLKVLHRLLATYLSDEQVVKETGEQMVWKEDFDAPDDVIPVSDPEIFSELQRISQMQTIAQRAQLRPDLYDGRKVEEGVLKMMKIKDAKQYLVPKTEPKPMHAINENIATALDQPIVAFPEQDHLAHIQSHLSFIEDPIFGANPMMAPQVIPGLLQNVKEHLLFFYGMSVHDVAQKALGDKHNLTEIMAINDPAVKSDFDKLLAAAGNTVHPKMQQCFSEVLPVIQRAQALLKQFQMPPPMDPSQVQMAKVQQDGQNNQAQTALGQQKLAQEAQQNAQENALKQAQQAQDAQTAAGQAQVTMAKTQADNQTKVQTNTDTNSSHEKIAGQSDSVKLQTTQEDNNTAMEIAAAEIEAGKKTNIKNGEAVGGKPRSD